MVRGSLSINLTEARASSSFQLSDYGSQQHLPMYSNGVNTSLSQNNQHRFSYILSSALYLVAVA